MTRNGAVAMLFHGVFVLFILAPLLVVVAVSFTPSGFLSLPTSSLSLRWYVEAFSRAESCAPPGQPSSWMSRPRRWRSSLPCPARWR